VSNHPLQVARVVIDTQTVLDWQFFGQPACGNWLPPSPQAGWQWLATAAMRDELAHVLGRSFGARWSTPAEQVLAFFDAHAVVLPAEPADVALARSLRCTDPDDQKFIDLAVSLRPAMLVSRDRAVLKLARRAAPHGVQILPPARWPFLAATA
jgi:uncharacterized protein